MASISIELDRATDPPESDLGSAVTDEPFVAEDEDLIGGDDDVLDFGGNETLVTDDDEVTGGGGNETLVIGGNGVNSKGTCKRVIFEDIATNALTDALPEFAPFENTNPIIAGHYKMWRGGHSNDILALAVGTREEKVSYVTGLLVPSVTLLVCFLFWMLVLLTLKRFGPERVGFLSGRRAKLPPKPTEETATGEKNNADDSPNETTAEENLDVNTESEKEIKVEKSKDSDEEVVPYAPDILTLKTEQWEALYARKKKEEFWMKTVVVIACIFVIAMAVTMAQKGIESLRESLADGKNSIRYASGLLTRSEEVVSDLSTGLESFQADVLDVLERSNTGLCPALRPEGFCKRAFDLETCDFSVQISYEKNITVDRLDINKTVSLEYTHYVDASEVADSIKDKIGLDGNLNLRQLLFPENQNIYSKTVNFFSSDWEIITTLNNLANLLSNISALADDTEGQVGDVEWVLFIAVAFDMIVGLLAAFMIIEIILGKRLPRCLKCITRRCLFPFFMTCVVLAFIFAMVFLTTSMALSDVCVDGPNQRIVSLVEHYTGSELAAEYISQFLKHWFSQCNKEPVSIREDQAFLNEAQSNLEAFQSSVLGVTDTVTEFCGTIDSDLFADTIATASNFGCALFGLLRNVRDALKCRTWMPLYYNTVHNVLCYNAINGFWSIAATQFTVVLMACLIMTFRAVFFDLEITGSDDIESIEADEKNEAPEASPPESEGVVDDDNAKTQVA